MSKYPDPIKVPDDVFVTRKQRLKQLLLSCTWGIVVRLSIIVGELVGVYFFGSAALLMDAIASTIDVFSSLFLVICIRYAARPPDENHPFGHGRFEPLMGLQLGLFMTLVGGGMFVQQALRLSSPFGAEVLDSRAWMIPFCAMILLELCYQFVIRVAKRQNSPALAADAIHYRIDGLTSLCATMALAVAAFVPEWGHTFDHIGALLISILMVGMGLNASWQNMNQIMDRVPDARFFATVTKAAERVEGVLGVEKVRIQNYGPDAHVDIDVEVDPQLEVEEAHRISQRVRVEIQKNWPAVLDVTVHIEPFYPNDH